jgi:hypothetical protein
MEGLLANGGSYWDTLRHAPKRLYERLVGLGSALREKQKCR